MCIIRAYRNHCLIWKEQCGSCMPPSPLGSIHKPLISWRDNCGCFLCILKILEIAEVKSVKYCTTITELVDKCDYRMVYVYVKGGEILNYTLRFCYSYCKEQKTFSKPPRNVWFLTCTRYHRVLGKHPLPGKRPFTISRGQYSILMHAIYILGKCPCGPK